MTIICTTEELAGETTYVDRESDIWYEADFMVNGRYAVAIYPKVCWEKVDELTIP